MARRLLCKAVVLLAALAAATAQDAPAVPAPAPAVTYNSDDVRRLGSPEANKCESICSIAAERLPDPRLAYGLELFCRDECPKCVTAVASQTLPGAGAPLPRACAATFKLPTIYEVVDDVLQGRVVLAASLPGRAPKPVQRRYKRQPGASTAAPAAAAGTAGQ